MENHIEVKKFDNTAYRKSLELDLHFICTDLGQKSDNKFPYEDIYKHYFKRKYLYESINPKRKVLDYTKIKFETLEDSNNWQLYAPVSQDGSIIVHKNNYYRKRIFAGTYLKGIIKKNNFGINEDVTVKWPSRDKVEDQYVHFFGKALPDEFILNKYHNRFYFNINPNAKEKDIIEFVEILIKKLNNRNLPFEFKIQTNLENYWADSAVLYVERRYFIMIIDVILDIYYICRHIFRREVPMFTYCLMDGIGFCENPASEIKTGSDNSFGQNRASEISELLVTFVKSNKTTPQCSDIIKKISQKYSSTYAGKYYLNHASKYEYYFKENIGSKNNTVYHKSDKPWYRLAIETGYDLCKEAYFDSRGRCNWLYKSDINTFENLDIGYLEGLSGVVFFLSNLYKITRKYTFKRHGYAALMTISSKKTNIITFNEFGFLNGQVSILYGILMAIEIFEFEGESNIKDLIDFCEEKLEELLNNVVKSIYDGAVLPMSFSKGIAGSLFGFLMLKKYFKKKKESELKFKKIATYICSQQVCIDTRLELVDLEFIPKDKGLFAWEEQGYKHFLTGLGYGSIGIAVVLKLYIQEFDDDDVAFPIAINRAIEFEKESMLKNQSQGIWPDFTVKYPNFPKDSIISGTFGGLSARLYYNAIDESNLSIETIEYDIKVAANFILDKRTDAYQLFENISNGLLDTLIDLYVFDQDILFDFEHKLQQMIEKVRYDNFFPIKNGEYGYHPGLNGIAGLGYYFLRLNNPRYFDSFILPKTEKSLNLK